MNTSRSIALKPRARLFVMSIAVLVLSGCGWHLRGARPLPEGVENIYIQAPSQALEDIWVQQLSENGVAITENPKDADATLVVTGETFENRVLSVDQDTGKVREFELAYSATVQMKGADGTIMLEPQTVRQLRNFIFDETAVIGAQSEQATLLREMRTSAMQQLLRQLQAGNCGKSTGECAR